ncbi:MAG: class I SAM-dependent methyltransferase [Alphaproteobacteria bacterium]
MSLPLVYAIIDKVLYWTFAFTYVWYAYYVIFHKNFPNIRTVPALTKKIIELLKQDFEAHQGGVYTIVDLGSGTGKLTREIAKAMPKAKVVGIERIWQTYMTAEWLRRWSRLDNLEYRKMDFFSYDLSSANVIVMYLLPYVMKDLSEKLHKEIKPGTLIIANKFALNHGWVPETLPVKTVFFHQKDLHIYRKA